MCLCYVVLAMCMRKVCGGAWLIVATYRTVVAVDLKLMRTALSSLNDFLNLVINTIDQFGTK